MEAKLFGPWNKVSKLLNKLPYELKEIGIASQRSVAEKYVRKVKAHLSNQDVPGWTPLSSRYADRKMGKFGHEEILIASWQYYENIKAWRENNVYHAGVPKGLTYDNGTEIAVVAKIHEDWSMIPGKPHRPLWNYTLNEDMGGLKGIKATVNEIIIGRLIKKGYPIDSLKI